MVLATHDWDAKYSHASLWLSTQANGIIGATSENQCGSLNNGSAGRSSNGLASHADDGSASTAHSDGLVAELRHSIGDILGSDFQYSTQAQAQFVRTEWHRSRRLVVEPIDCLVWVRQ